MRAPTSLEDNPSRGANVRILLTTATLCSIVGASAPGRCQTPPKASVESPGSSSSALDRAARAFEQAEEAYAAGDVREARARMHEAFRVSGDPLLLYNLGQLDRELGACETALAEYRDYLRLAREPEHRAEAEHYADELEKRCSSPPSRAASLPAPLRVSTVGSAAPAPAPRYLTTLRVVGWSLVGTSAVAAAASVYFTVRMRDTENEAEAFVAKNAAAPPSERVPWSPAGTDLVSRGKREQNWAWATGILGVTTAATGAVLLWRASRTAESAVPAWSLVVSPHTAAASYEFQF